MYRCETVLSDVVTECGTFSQKETHEAVASKSLYELRAKAPQQIVLQQLRRHFVPIDAPSGVGNQALSAKRSRQVHAAPSSITVTAPRRKAK
jgi:hypothetical protein